MKAGIFFFGSIYERTGAGKVVRSFAESIQQFSNNGIEATVFDLSSNGSVNINKSNQTKRIKGQLRDLIARTSIGTKFCIENLYFKKGKIVFDKYIKSSNKYDVFIFHEIFTCWAYIDYCEKNNISPQKYILVLHTNGEVYKMLKIYYPKLCNTNYEKDLNNRSIKCFENAGLIVFVSNKSEQHFNKMFNNKYKIKTRVVYNGIPNLQKESFPSFDGDLKIVTVGTVNARKNQIMQIDCIQRVLSKTNVFLTIVGDGDKLDECKKRANELGVNNNLSFLGARDDIPDILSESNIFLMSSFDEGLPISAIEAMRSKLPLILTDVGGNCELVDGNGFLVNPTIESITKHILLLSEDRRLQKAMSKKSYELFLRKFSIESMINNYSSLIKEL